MRPPSRGWQDEATSQAAATENNNSLLADHHPEPDRVRSWSVLPCHHPSRVMKSSFTRIILVLVHLLPAFPPQVLLVVIKPSSSFKYFLASSTPSSLIHRLQPPPSPPTVTPPPLLSLGWPGTPSVSAVAGQMAVIDLCNAFIYLLNFFFHFSRGISFDFLQHRTGRPMSPDSLIR
jgi:hypothetical protein